MTSHGLQEIKLYGHPSLVEVSEKLPARVLYQQLLVLLREAYKLRSLPSFTAYLVNYEVMTLHINKLGQRLSILTNFG